MTDENKKRGPGSKGSSDKPLHLELPPTTVISVAGGVLDCVARPQGATLIWLWPAKRPAAPAHPDVRLEGDRFTAVALRPGRSVVILRGVVPETTVTLEGNTWTVCLPSEPEYAGVSRAPTRITLVADGRLTVETEARGPQRFWVDLLPVQGPCGPSPVSPWSAIAVGPVVLWHVPQDLEAACRHVAPASPSLQKSVSGFRFSTESTADVVAHLQRRATMRIQVPKTAASERWEASQPFLLAGEPGSGKTTAARAVYRSVPGVAQFAAVQPVAVEHEVDLVAFTGSANFAHDGVKVPDQAGHLDVATHEDGVLLVDEVHTLNNNLKKHLIDLLTEWTFRPRGDNTRRKRIRGLLVFATNRPDVVRDPRRFPNDLFARMGGEAGIIELPPLRRRRGEIVFLAEAVLAELVPNARLSENAVQKLLLHTWPLNHWELEDVVREAHSLASTQGASEILPEHLKVRPVEPGATVRAGPPEPSAAPVQPSAAPSGSTPVQARPSAPSSGPKAQGAAWRIPESVGWPELFQALYHYGSFTQLRDAWQAQLGIRNTATVNRRIGRLVRCARCDPATCPRCFLGAVARTDAGLLVDQLERLADRAAIPPDEVNSWMIAALRELVVERVAAFNNNRARAALADAHVTGRQGLEALLVTLKDQLQDD